MKIFDAFLNGYFVFLALLFVTGGYIPAGKLLEERVMTDKRVRSVIGLVSRGTAVAKGRRTPR